MANKSDGSVVLTQLQVAFLWECDNNGPCGRPFSCLVADWDQDVYHDFSSFASFISVLIFLLTSLLSLAPSGSSLFFFRSHLWSQRSRISGVPRASSSGLSPLSLVSGLQKGPWTSPQSSCASSPRSNHLVQPECPALVFDQLESDVPCRTHQLHCHHSWMLVHIPELWKCGKDLLSAALSWVCLKFCEILWHFSQYPYALENPPLVHVCPLFHWHTLCDPICWDFSRLFPSHLTQSKNVPLVSVHLMQKFLHFACCS